MRAISRKGAGLQLLRMIAAPPGPSASIIKK
jgi:hypothetical protein